MNGTRRAVRDVSPDYEDSLAMERRIYEDCVNVHALPPIFHYWSHRHLREKLLPFGIGNINDIFRTYLKRQCQRGPEQPKRFVSLGSGNCDLELELAGHLRASRCGDFVIDCVDLNPAMLERGRTAAADAGLANHLTFIEADLNQWSPDCYYHAALANQSLHHVVNLERLFAQTKRSLLPGGGLVTSDMIGRNGHRRWPEALEIVQEYWRKLPPSRRFNRKFREYQELFEDWDCSVEGFEGIRSQDILPLLLKDFHFELFLPFGNIIDPFVDRSFGFNFNADGAWDKSFIDQVHARDEKELAAGRIKPTHMLAIVTLAPHGPPILFGHLTPESCVRHPGVIHSSQPEPAARDHYDWREWPLDVRQELGATARCYAESASDAKRQAGQVARLENELIERTEWALSLDQSLAERTAQVAGLHGELEERTDWVHSLQRELEERTTWALRLRDELEAAEERARQLSGDLERTTAEAQRLALELGEYLHNPINYLARIAKGVGRRVSRLVLARQPAGQVLRRLRH